MTVTEGMVVVVVSASVDSKVRVTDKDNTGTVWFIHGGEIAVLLKNGDLWKGARHSVYLAQSS